MRAVIAGHGPEADIGFGNANVPVTLAVGRRLQVCLPEFKEQAAKGRTPVNDDTDDTVIRRVLVLEPGVAERQAALRRAADALDVLAGVLAGYPKRHPEAWSSEAWQKDLKDLEIGCEQLRRHALELRILSEDVTPP